MNNETEKNLQKFDKYFEKRLKEQKSIQLLVPLLATPFAIASGAIIGAAYLRYKLRYEK